MEMMMIMVMIMVLKRKRQHHVEVKVGQVMHEMMKMKGHFHMLLQVKQMHQSKHRMNKNKQEMGDKYT